MFSALVKFIRCTNFYFTFMDPLEFHFKHPTTIQVFGQTRCGKTRLVGTILEKQLIQPFATRIIWVYSEWQQDYYMIRERYRV